MTLTSDDPLFDLAALAALLGGWPTLGARCRTEDDAAAVCAGLARLAGPLPQAELLDDEGDLTLRVALPGLDLATWLPLSAALGRRSAPFWLAPGLPAPLQRALDVGRVVAEHRRVGGVIATRTTRRDGPPAPGQEVRRHQPDRPDVRALLGELVAACDAALGPGAIRSDAARTVVRRRDGAIGLELPLADAALPLDAALAALAGVVAARAGHRTLRCSPLLDWEDLPAPRLRLWLLVQPAAALPTGDPGPADAPWLPAGALADDARLVVPADDHEAATAALIPHAAALVGDEPRWVRAGDAWRFAAVWRAPPAALPGLVLPGPPRGLEADWEDLTDHPHRGPARWLVRYRDALDDRDRLERCAARPADAADHALAACLTEALAAVDATPAPGDRWLRPIADSAGRPGLAVHLDAEAALTGAAYATVLDALGLPHPDLEPLATVAFTATDLVVHLWRTHAATAVGLRRWD